MYEPQCIFKETDLRELQYGKNMYRSVLLMCAVKDVT